MIWNLKIYIETNIVLLHQTHCCLRPHPPTPPAPRPLQLHQISVNTSQLWTHRLLLIVVTFLAKPMRHLVHPWSYNRSSTVTVCGRTLNWPDLHVRDMRVWATGWPPPPPTDPICSPRRKPAIIRPCSRLYPTIVHCIPNFPYSSRYLGFKILSSDLSSTLSTPIVPWHLGCNKFQCYYYYYYYSSTPHIINKINK